jgi:phage baseplate assembly protein gpV
MFDIIPTHLSGMSYNNGGAFSQNSLLIGEVQKIYPTDDPQNVSKRTTEYDVLVGLRVNNTAVTKIFRYVTVMDIFGGLADSFTKTYRADTSGNRTDSNRKKGPGLGSKVLLLSVSGENLNTVIIGGVRDNKRPPEENLGHNLAFTFNGVQVAINDAGELSLQVHGKTDNEGKTDHEVGTAVNIAKDGNVAVTTKDCSFTINQKNGTVTVKAKNDVVIDSPKTHIGSSGASENALMGQKWLSLMQKLIQAISKITVYAAGGPSSPPINAPEFLAILTELQTILSQHVYVE